MPIAAFAWGLAALVAAVGAGAESVRARAVLEVGTLARDDAHGLRALRAALRAAGLSAAPREGAVSAERLRDVALWASLAAPPPGSDRAAYGDDEIEVLRGWVASGGALLVALAPAPRDGARSLVESFHYRVSEDPVRFAGRCPRPLPSCLEGRAPIFVYENSTLHPDHPIRKGRAGRDEPLDRVVGSGGLALSPRGARRDGGAAVLTLPGRTLFATSSGEVPGAGGWVQGVALAHGKGRVFLSGDADAFAAEENVDFVTNVVRWLVGSL